jgi:pimeloyl-ACP methyl ester carboxylesterase
MSVPHAIEEGRFIDVNGVDQWITIRGADRSYPALLIVAGPGAAFSRLAPFFAPWEERFTLVQWDQPGAGATQAKNGSAMGPLTLERLSRDGVAVAAYARERLAVDGVIVLGVSGGSIVALQMVKARPELFAAYVGTGQIVTWRVQETLGYELALHRARAAGDTAAVAELEQIGRPPYRDAATDAIKAKYVGAMTAAEQRAFAALEPDAAAALRTPPRGATWVPADLPLPDSRALAMAAYEQLRDDIARFDARALGLGFAVPMYFFQGDEDLYTVTSEVEAYVRDVQAPHKAFARIAGGGHSAVFMRDEFIALLVGAVGRDRTSSTPST